MVTEANIQLDLKSCTLAVYSGNIILMQIKPDAEIDLENARKITESIMQLANNQPFKVIVDARNVFGTFTAKARNHFANDKPYNQLRLNSAVIVNNLPVRLLVNFYQKFNFKKKNFKVVENLDEALKWLK